MANGTSCLPIFHLSFFPDVSRISPFFPSFQQVETFMVSLGQSKDICVLPLTCLENLPLLTIIHKTQLKLHSPQGKTQSSLSSEAEVQGG